MCSIKKLFLKISHHSQENTCVRVSFQSSCDPSDQQLFKKRFLRRCFSLDIGKFLKTLILKKMCEQLFIHEDCKIGVKCFSSFAGKYLYQSVFLINIVVACNLSLSLSKKHRDWCFLDIYLKFSTTTFLKREKKALL